MSKEYTCEHCKGVFTEGWTEEEAQAEYQQNFTQHMPQKQIDEGAIRVCDDCYKYFMGELKKQGMLPEDQQ